MTTTAKKKTRLRMVMIAAAALGCSSATLSGALAALAMQHSVVAPPTATIA